MTDQSLKRVLQTLDLLDREIHGLNRTRERLFRRGSIDADWVKGIAQDPSREEMRLWMSCWPPNQPSNKLWLNISAENKASDEE